MAAQLNQPNSGHVS